MSALGGGCAGQASVPKADFLVRGDAVCEQGRREWVDLVEKMPGRPAEVREKYVLEKLAPALKNIVNQLRNLGYPAGDQEYLDSIYADVDAEIAKMVDQPSTGLQFRVGAPFARPAPRFLEYGLVQCSQF
jgi:hypothetical protein